MDIKKILYTILSIFLAGLGGAQYQQSSLLNDVQKDVKELSQVVSSLAHRDFSRIDSAE